MAQDVSKLAAAVSEKSGVTVSDNDLFQLTTQHMSDPAGLQDFRAGMDFRSYGALFEHKPDLFNDYMDNLLQQIGVIFQKAFLWENPLQIFKRGLITAGGIENVVYDTVKPNLFNPKFRDRKGQIRSPFEPNWNSPKVSQFIELLDMTSKTSIQDTVDQQYFQTLQQLHNYVWAQITALINGQNALEYAQSKLTLSEAVAQNKMMTYNIHDTHDEKENTRKIVKILNVLSRKMQYISRMHNRMGVNVATPSKDVVVILPIETSVNMDLDYFSTIFNPETSRLNVKTVEIDEFPSVWRYAKDHVVTQEDIDKGFVDVKHDGKQRTTYSYWEVGDTIPKGSIAMPNATDAVKVLDGSKIAGMVIDKDAYQIWDSLPATTSVVNNPEGRYANILLNKKVYFSYVSGLNGQALYVSDDTDGDVTFVPDKTHTVSTGGGK